MTSTPTAMRHWPIVANSELTIPLGHQSCGYPPLFTKLSKLDNTTIEGEAQWWHCDTCVTISYDIDVKSKEPTDFILYNFHGMDDYTPARWTNPTVPDRDNYSKKKSLRPVIYPNREWEDLHDALVARTDTVPMDVEPAQALLGAHQATLHRSQTRCLLKIIATRHFYLSMCACSCV